MFRTVLRLLNFWNTGIFEELFVFRLPIFSLSNKMDSKVIPVSSQGFVLKGEPLSLGLASASEESQHFSPESNPSPGICMRLLQPMIKLYSLHMHQFHETFPSYNCNNKTYVLERSAISIPSQITNELSLETVIYYSVRLIYAMDFFLHCHV